MRSKINERLYVENFVTIKKAEWDIKKINVIIGPQAVGKSLLVKILYFFRIELKEIIQRYLMLVKRIERRISVERLDVNTFISDSYKRLKRKFVNIFPDLIYKDEEFLLYYSYKDLNIAITKKAGYEEISIDFQAIEALFNKWETENLSKIRSAVLPYLRGLGSVFIPASRSFLPIFLRFIFPIMKRDFYGEEVQEKKIVDPLFLDMGYEYLEAKYDYFNILSSIKKEDDTHRLYKVVELIDKILKGTYHYENQEEFIKNESGRYVPLSSSSSGQQEILPFLLIALYHLHNSSSKNYQKPMFFIEEPEAHLFPESQKDVMSLIAMLYNISGNQVVITTHSPYILVALNHLIMAGSIIKTSKKDNEVRQKVLNIVGEDNPIDFNDVGAYTLENGILKSIMDSKSHLIDADTIDSVSEEFNKIFDQLLDIKYGSKNKEIPK